MFCHNCGSRLSDNANFCSNCGTRVLVVAPAKPICPNCGTVGEVGDSFCFHCGCALGQSAAQQQAPVQQQAAVQQVPVQQAMPYQQQVPVQQAPVQQAVPYQQPVSFQQQAVPAQQQAPMQQQIPMQQPTLYQQATSAYRIPENVVPKKMTGKRTIPTNKAFTHEELLQFMQERWDASRYNQIVLDPKLKSYTDLYVVLPATNRHMIIVYSRDEGSLFSKGNKVVLSYIFNPDAAAQTMVMAVPTSNVFFGAAKLQNIASEKADREGPTEEALQKYADYMHFLLKQAGYLEE